MFLYNGRVYELLVGKQPTVGAGLRSCAHNYFIHPQWTDRYAL